MEYWFWADRFGWTPAQVDELPLRLRRLRDVTLLVEEVRADRRGR